MPPDSQPFAAAPPQLDRALAGLHAGGTGYGIALVDVDHLSRVRQAYGYAGSRFVFDRVEDLVTDRFSPETVVIRRPGGDEIAILFPGCNDGDMIGRRAEALRRDLANLPHEVAKAMNRGDAAPVHVTASFGIAVSAPGNDEEGEHVFNRAYDALMFAKKQRNQVCIASPSGGYSIVSDSIDERPGDGRQRRLPVALPPVQPSPTVRF